MFGLGKKRPSARDVALRAVALKVVVIHTLAAPPRGMLAQWQASWSADEFRQFEANAAKQAEVSWRWPSSLGARLTPWEKQFSKTNAASMTEGQHIDGSWRAESLLVLLWALGVVAELPHYDTQADNEAMKQWRPDPAWIKQVSLIPRNCIDKARDLAELWHWRSRTRQLIESQSRWPESLSNPDSGITSYDGIVRHTAKTAHGRGDLPATADEDFAVFGKAYRDLSADEWSIVTSITMERHRALNWLSGYAPGNRWDETPTDT